MTYTYVFSVWPHESWGFNKSVFELFEMMNSRFEMQFTQQQFEWFRSELSHHGVTLREIERFPYHEPETIL